MIVPRMLMLGLVSMSLGCAAAKTPHNSGDAPPADTIANEAEAEVGDEQDTACEADTECVPAQCCHPTSCVPASQAPDCSDIACTLECQPGTMDCGQGHCACQDGSCAAVMDGEI